MQFLRPVLVCGAAVLAVFSAAGCRSSSYESKRIYQYQEEPSPSRASDRPAKETQREEADDEWNMESPGQMIVDPDD